MVGVGPASVCLRLEDVMQAIHTDFDEITPFLDTIVHVFLQEWKLMILYRFPSRLQLKVVVECL